MLRVSFAILATVFPEKLALDVGWYELDVVQIVLDIGVGFPQVVDEVILVLLVHA